MIRDMLEADLAEYLAQVQSLGMPKALYQSHVAVLAKIQENLRDLIRQLPSAGVVDSEEGEGA